MININSMDPKQLSILSTLVAIQLSEGQDANSLNVLGNFTVAVGSIMLTIAAQQQNIQSIIDNNKPDNTSKKDNSANTSENNTSDDSE